MNFESHSKISIRLGTLPGSRSQPEILRAGTCSLGKVHKAYSILSSILTVIGLSFQVYIGGIHLSMHEHAWLSAEGVNRISS